MSERIEIMKLKSFAAMITVLTVFTAINVKAEDSEAIKLNIEFLNSGKYEETHQNFTMVDLREYANRDFVDDVQGDGEGGWSDQGVNDMREFPYRGVTEFLNIPFDIIDPSQNGGNAIVAVQGQNDKGVKNRYEINIAKKAAGVYFLHSSPWANGSYIGKYTLNYTDGTSTYLNLFDSVHISDCYGRNSSDNFRPIWTGKNEVLNQLSLYLFALSNPYPDKEIKSLVLETDGNGPYIMVVGITLTDKGPYLPASEEMSMLNPDTEDWYEVEKIDTRGSVLDMSYTLDAPAGKHGKLLKKGENFVFADGEKAKFWGTNITGRACFTDKEKSEETAEKIAACGFNLVRFSRLSENYEKISDEDKERIAYFIEKLNEKGIYVSIAGSESDRVEVFYQKDSIERAKEFFKDILTYKRNDKLLGNSVCMIEFTDGASMYDLNAGKVVFNAKDSLDEVKEKFNQFIKSKYPNAEKLKEAWNGGYDLNSWESLGNLDFISAWNNPVFSQAKRHDIMEFFNFIQTEYYNEIRRSIETLGIDVLMTSNGNSDRRLMMGDTYMGRNTDFSARNYLWEKPVANDELLTSEGWYDGKKSNVKDAGAGMFSVLASKRPADTPYVITKWGTSFMNKYSSELPYMMAAVSAQQNWTPVSYAFINDEVEESKCMNNHYSIYNNPAYMGMMPAASILYQTMPEAGAVYTNVVEEASILMADEVNSVADVWLLSKKSNVKGGEETKTDKRLKYGSDIIRNEGIYWDKKDGIFFAETNRVEAVTGFFTGEEILAHFNVKPEAEFAAVSLCCLENKDFDKADKFLLTLAGRARNKDMFVNNKSRVEKAGSECTVAERINAEVTLKIKGDVKVYALDFNGKRVEEIKTEKNKNGQTVISVNENGKSINFEIERIAN